MQMTKRKKEFARLLRGNQTPFEKKVWTCLRNRRLLGLKFRRQHVLEGFVVDFYCPEYKLAIEIDGGIHTKQKEYDQWRQELIESKFNTVIRVNNADLENNCVALIRKIKGVIPKLRRSPLPQGEGAFLLSPGEGTRRC